MYIHMLQLHTLGKTDSHIHRIVWGLSFNVVIVCILWMAFFSGKLDWVDHSLLIQQDGRVGTFYPCNANYLS